MPTLLTDVRMIPAYAVIIRATHERGATQRAALAELYRRGLWLHDGSNGGDDQQAMAIHRADFGTDRLASKALRDATLTEMGYAP
jgi:hypothetical protein